MALIGGGAARTYVQAALIAGVHLGTLYRHLGRVRQRHPDLYESIRAVRLYQLAWRHERAIANAKEHSRAYFRRTGKWFRWW